MKNKIIEYKDEIVSWLLIVTTIIFIMLKLFNIITWSWWWIFTPIWSLFALLMGTFLIAVMAIGIYYMSGVITIYWKHWRGKL